MKDLNVSSNTPMSELTIRVANLKVEFCMSSMILERSQMKVLAAYNTANDIWLLKADSWYRKLDGFCGTMQGCIERIVEVINDQLSPYYTMQNNQLFDNVDLKHKPLEMKVTS